jgi:hypothetical protein
LTNNGITPSDKQLFEIQEYLSYDKDTGILTWKKRKANCVFIGKEAGHLNKKGYKCIEISGKEFKAHRIAWYLHYNEWPYGEIDHKNGNSADNRIENLRIADRSKNCQNFKCHRNGRPVGVYFHKNAWVAQAPKKFLDRDEPEPKYIGRYKTMEEAGQAVIDFCTKM